MAQHILRRERAGEELLEYDPALYELVDEMLPDETKWADCYKKQP